MKVNALKSEFTVRIASDPEYRRWVLLRLYTRQTWREQLHWRTFNLNGMGFSQPDALVLTPLAQKRIQGELLTDFDDLLLTTLLPKYWKQFLALQKPQRPGPDQLAEHSIPEQSEQCAA